MTKNETYDDTEALYLLSAFAEALAPDREGATKAGRALMAALVDLGGTISTMKIALVPRDSAGPPSEKTVVSVSIANIGVNVVHEGYDRFIIYETHKPIMDLRFNPATGLIEGPDEEPVEGKPVEVARRVPVRRPALAVMVEQITKAIMELARR